MKKHAEEMEAVRTTIVGGRPPGSGRRDSAVPRGIEVLLKKAAVDEAFRKTLLAQRGAAAADIGLELDPAESAMLGVIAEEQLAGIIRQTVVPTEQRRVFMGTVAAAMLAVIGVGLAGCGKSDSTGAQPDVPGQGNNPQSLPQSAPLIVKGMVAAPPVTSTQTAPATGNTTPPDTPVVVFGLRMEPPPATSTQPTPPPPPTEPAVDTQPRLLISAGILIMAAPPATSTQPAIGPGARDASPTPADNLPRAIGGMMARPPATSRPPATATGTAPATLPSSVPAIIRGIRADVPPATSTQPATATGTAPATPSANTSLQIAGMLIDRPPETGTQTAPSTETKRATTGTAPATTRQGYGGTTGGFGGGAGPARN